MTELPTDPMILLSFVNTKLRDDYKDLEAMCDDLELDSTDIEKKLASIDYHYDKALNRFA
ncbi:MAG: DUF4250 domain-containing protein [Lachnospiraceae bacterium]|nr:DUF4250 domain-containing protein [Lachnospiraceae bacterium]